SPGDPPRVPLTGHEGLDLAEPFVERPDLVGDRGGRWGGSLFRAGAGGFDDVRARSSTASRVAGQADCAPVEDDHVKQGTPARAAGHAVSGPLLDRSLALGCLIVPHLLILRTNGHRSPVLGPQLADADGKGPRCRGGPPRTEEKEADRIGPPWSPPGS